MPNRVVVFDTTCLLCSRFIQILLRNDNGVLLFTGFESEFSNTYLPQTLVLTPESIVFYEDGMALIKSEAFFNIINYSKWQIRWIRVFRILPTVLLDKVYDWIARNRYSWFGQSDQCYLPNPRDTNRFLD